MQIFDKPDTGLPDTNRGVALGFFDGIHRGHLDLLRTLVYRSHQLKLTPAVFTFPEHPEAVLRPGQPFPGYLSSLEERLDLIAACGVAELYLQNFDTAFAEMDPLVFLDQIVAARLRARLVVVGPDYRFGRQGRGDIGLLRSWGASQGIEIQVVSVVGFADDKISSSRIRSLIQAGDLVLAASLLGRPYRMSGTVVTGRGLGRRLGFPTANLAVPPGKICPAFGVYATRVQVGTRTYQSITNIGLRPTVHAADTEPVIETYLYDADIPLYGQVLNVDFLEKIRPERRFDSLLQLGAQVREDLEHVRLWHQQAEHCYEQDRIAGIPIYTLSTDRFAQAALHLVFHVAADARRTAGNALLMRVLTASCRRYPSRISLASALDALYGASLESNVEKSGNLQTIYLSAEALVRWTDGSKPFRDTCSLLFDVLLDPLLDEDGYFDAGIVESEQRNLLMELAARENDRGKYAYDRCLALFCGGQIEGISASGQAQDIAGISRADLAAAYQDLLRQTHLAIYLGGQIDQETVEICRNGLLRLPEGCRPTLYPGLQPAPFDPQPAAPVTEFKTVEQARLVLAFKGMPPYFSHQSIIASALNSMFGGDAHSLLFDVVREKMGLAYQVYSMNQRHLSALFVLAGVAADVTGQALAAIKDQLAALAAGSFSDQLLERTKSMLETAILSQGDDLSTLLSAQITGRLYGRLLSRSDSLALLQSVTRAQVIGMAARLQLVTTYVLTAAPSGAAAEV